MVKAHSDSQSKAIHFNERFYMGCQITAYPESTVKLYFRECLPQKPCSDTWNQLSLNQTSASVITLQYKIIFLNMALMKCILSL